MGWTFTWQKNVSAEVVSSFGASLKALTAYKQSDLRTQITMNGIFFLWIISFAFKYLDVFLMFEWTFCIHGIKNILKQN